MSSESSSSTHHNAPLTSNDLSRREIRRKMQLAHQEKYHRALPESHAGSESIYSDPIVQDPEKNLPNSLLNPSAYIQTFLSLDADALLPAKAKSMLYSMWEVMPCSMFAGAFAVAVYGALFWCGTRQYSTFVLTKLGILNTWSRSVVFLGFCSDTMGVGKVQRPYLAKYINALRIQQRDYYEEKWGIPDALKESIDQDPFWVRVREEKAKHQESREEFV